MLGFSEDFIRQQCEDNDVPHIEDKPKFPDKDILDIALEGADMLSSDDNAIKMLKKFK